MMDAVIFGKGIVLGTVAAQIAILYLYRFESYSRAVFVIDAALLVLLLSGSRASFRLVAEFVLRHSSIRRDASSTERAGRASARFARRSAPASRAEDCRPLSTTIRCIEGCA
jgi:hypothetical protein